VLLLLGSALALGGARCAEDAPAAPPPQVDVARPLVREVVDWDDYTARIDAVDRVEVRARVSGYLESVHFTDGEIVEQGDLLFVIDPRPYRAAVERAEAELRGAAARLDLAEREAQRAQLLLGHGVLSQEDADTRATALRDAAAAREAAQASLRQARLELEFTQVRAPIRGRIGRDLVTLGNLISGGSPDSTLLTTIVSLDPIHAYFDADERAVLRYERLAQRGDRPSSRDAPNPVLLGLADEDGFPHRGQMDFVDNQLDPRTGTMRARAVFTNPDATLLPGMFARVRLPGSGRYQALLVPDEAIGTDQGERFVLVVDAEQRAQERSVETGPQALGLRVVRNGLAPDDRVIVRGLSVVRAGDAVAPHPVEIAASAVEPARDSFPSRDPAQEAFPAPRLAGTGR
jgi:RND family efflux transporter MFP subunit